MAEPSPGPAVSPGAAEGADAAVAAQQASMYAGELIPPSFFDARKRRLDTSGERLSLTRLGLALSLTPSGNPEEAVALLKDGVTACAGVEPSGLCLGLGRGLICIVECGAEDAMGFLGRLRDHLKHPDTATVKCVTLLSACEDCPTRVFAGWECRFVSKPRETGIDLASEGALTIANGVYANLVTLGKKLTERRLTKADYSSALDNLKQYFGEYVPSSERVVALSETDDLMNVAEYLELYASPINLTLESDSLWPPQQVISDYL